MAFLSTRDDMWKNGTFGPVLTSTKMLSNANKDIIKGFNSKRSCEGFGSPFVIS